MRKILCLIDVRNLIPIGVRKNLMINTGEKNLILNRGEKKSYA